jgi:tetratricopeptide (TPR) repeat protein
MALNGCGDKQAAAPEAGAETVSLSQTVQFPTSCSADTQPRFSKTVELLHSFEYVETSKRFNGIIEQEPSCAMAYWGVAMSIWHPLWAPPSQTDLENGIAALTQSDGLDKTPREVALINALKQFYASADITTNKQRGQAYADAMAAVSATYPEDVEIAIFAALGLRATADPRDKSYPVQIKAGETLKALKEDHPLHPGILHYIIHSYDFPGLASQALEEAKVYAGSAKNSSHAQHMPSHIFTRLGMWEDSLSSNHDSTQSAVNYTKQADLPGHYDEGLHSIDYLMYAMLQTGRDAEAKELLSQLTDIKKTDTENFKVAFTYAMSPARYVLERRAWDEASQLELLRPDFLWDDFKWAQAIHYFARGIGAARSGNLNQARAERDKILELQAGLPDTLMAYISTEVQVQADMVKAWIAMGEGDIETGLSLAASAADFEDSVDKHPVTPGEVLPARELYGDMLLSVNNPEEALAQYETVLASSPNRLNAMIGAAAAASALGDNALAQAYQKTITDQTRHGTRSGLVVDPK